MAGNGGISSAPGFFPPAILLKDGRLSPGAVEGRAESLSQGEDFERCLELLVDGVLLCDEEPGSCFDDLLLLEGDCVLLLDGLGLLDCFEDFSFLLEDGLEFAMGKGGNAQSRFVSSGEGGLRGIAIAVFLGAFHGDFRADVALTGEPIEPLLLLAGVNSPANWLGT